MTPFNPQRRDGRSQHGRSGSGPCPKTIETLWPNYLSGGYFDAKGNLKVEYVSRKSVERLVKEMCGNSQIRLTSHQARRYFGHCRAIETRLKSGGAAWASVLPEIKKLDVAAADGFAKSPPKIPKLFHDFIQRNVAVIREERDFLRGFLPHFEALMGFGAAYF